MPPEIIINSDEGQGPKRRKTLPTSGVVFETSRAQLFAAAEQFSPLNFDEVIVLGQDMSRGRAAEGIFNIISGRTQVVDLSRIYKPKSVKKDEAEATKDVREVKYDGPVSSGIVTELMRDTQLTDYFSVELGAPLGRDELNDTKILEQYDPASNQTRKVSLRETLSDEELEARQEVLLIAKKKHIPPDEARIARQKLAVYMEEGKVAKSRMIEHNIRLVPYVLKKKGYSRTDYYEELIGRESETLIRAVELYDWRYGFAFSTVADKMIRLHAKRSFNTLLGSSDRQVYLLNQIERARGELMMEFKAAGRRDKPRIVDIAARLGMSADVVGEVLGISAMTKSMISVDQPSGEGQTPISLGRLDKGMDMVEMRRDISLILSKAHLTAREREIFTLVGSGEVNYSELAKILGLTPSGVRGIYYRAQEKIRRVVSRMDDYEIEG